MKQLSADALVDRYLNLRNARDEMKKVFAERMAPINEEMGQVEASLLKLLDSIGAQNARTESGTAYISKRTSITVNAWDDFLTYVRDNDLWQLLEKRVSKSAAAEYQEENGVYPPGLDVSTERVINIRKSPK